MRDTDDTRFYYSSNSTVAAPVTSRQDHFEVFLQPQRSLELASVSGCSLRSLLFDPLAAQLLALGSKKQRGYRWHQQGVGRQP